MNSNAAIRKEDGRRSVALLSSRKCRYTLIGIVVFIVVVVGLVILVIQLSSEPNPKFSTAIMINVADNIPNSQTTPSIILIAQTNKNPIIPVMNNGDTINISTSNNLCNHKQQHMPLILMTFNVQFYKTSQKTKSIATFIRDHHPDVVCLQENIDSNGWKARKLEALDLTTTYILAAECIAESIHGFHLANTIYVQRKHMQCVQQLPSVNLTLTSETIRCASVIRLYDTIIANLHLCGGRFDDKSFQDLKDHKYLQLKRLIDRHQPDIIIGDFNSENSDEGVMKQLKQYQFYQSLNKADQILFQHYFMSGAQYLRKQTKYLPAYNESSVGVTSAYGGTPDWIYVKNQTRLTGKIGNYNAITTNLSDHNAVIIEYLFGSLKGT